ncbi:hypothetical protein ACFL5G_02335 [Candidatus Margulisiibacteriota bacterium]
MKIKHILLIISFILLLAFPSLAVYRTTTPVEYLGIRQMGMGGAGVAVLNSVETIYLNPASIVDDGDHFNFPIIPLLITNGTGSVGDDFLTSYNDFKDAWSESGDDKTAATKLFTELVPKSFTVGGSVPFGYVGKSPYPGLGTKMALAGYSRIAGNFSLFNPVTPRIEYSFKSDLIFGLTFARIIDKDEKILPGVKDFAIGYTIKHINRLSAFDISKDNETAEITVTDIINDDVYYQYYDASGWGFDLGFAGKFDTDLGPGRFGLAFYNIAAYLDGHSFLTTSENSGVEGVVHRQVEPTAKIGWAIETKLLNTLTNDFFKEPTLVAIDYDIVYPSRSYIKRMHLGFEQPLHDWLFWQFGLNQGYGTMGIQCRWDAYQLGFAYFTEEAGREVGQQPNGYYLLNAGLLF